ncbi:uncharacterized protein MYCFIDRAFT_85932 [Pseudocercospora fijiensis CIRAD86]|uniref:Uncharacterized protein n=1 Tax=Pseudocercospora fijiensis (strain CIRAD86) TaxID=383855 RepID=N1Q6J6_PSEFD|nr:uncharacterized protein MYCFIDRAFT_85932 [Pseudocercospora fijiensis CIRAD86]EME88035.1 hypothetical protein MYCFIDRAFT_85932 [Pseudocercospora fijiensis CIRAD86]
MSVDTQVLVVGAGMSGLGLAVQLIRQYNCRDLEIVEREKDVGGTWLVNTYPGCGCDVASHFYSYSFALNPDWTRKFSLRPEIQAYFRNVAEHYNLIPHISFNTAVQTARWCEKAQLWEVTIMDHSTQTTSIRRCRILVSGVGSLSIPKKCEINGAESFKGPLFHSAQWDHTLDWSGKKVVVLGNGCSATQFVPVMAETAGSLTQFARQAHYLAERPNPIYSSPFKALMRYMPLAMRLYRFTLYAEMEKDFAGFDIEAGRSIRQRLKTENEQYVKAMAPKRYWDALIPKHEIGCKRKVMDTDYLACLHRENVELVYDDPVESINEHGVVTQSGRHVEAEAIILATGFEVYRMLYPMEIIGENGVSLNEYWNKQHDGAAQAYLGTSVPGFKNFFVMVSPNTVTGHLSVIYTVECQINYVLRLIEPILSSSRASSAVTSVDVKLPATLRDSNWMQEKLKALVWSSGCTSWALDPKTNLNIAMYPQYQFMFWLRSIFIPARDFEYQYREGKGLQKKQLAIGGWKAVRNALGTITVFSAIGIAAVRRAGGLSEARGWIAKVFAGIWTEMRGPLRL